jgi:hypothetical protein
VRQNALPFYFIVGKENYSSREIASTGHSSTHAPHSVQSSESTLAVSSTVIASAGHISAHAPHPVQASSSILAGMFYYLLSFLKISEQINKNKQKMSIKKLRDY